ncbi:MAG: putative thiol:disulfide interchange protein DsbC [Arcobacter lacus]|jgi:thiol:disulfide interchange protein DsbC|nr:MAG: putative thiol:disulfide interchange protein DsbC [Arcobacter lacus]
MLKILSKSLLTVSAMTLMLNASSTLISQDKIEEIKELELFKRANIDIVNGHDLDSLYYLNIKVQGNPNTVYLTKDKKYLVSGEVINTTSGKKLTAPVDLSILEEGKEALTFGKGSQELVLFTDPECPYCKKFESYFKQIEDKVKIKIFFFPLDFHKNARDLSAYVMSKDTNEDKVKAMLNTTKDSENFKNRNIPAEKLNELYSSIDEQIKLGVQLGVQGTPALFDKDGNSVSWTELLASHGIQVK